MDELIERTIEQLDYSGSDGLLTAVDGDALSGRGFAWRELRDRGQVDAAYFHGGVPLIAFASVDSLPMARHAHRRLWNLSRVPLLVVSSGQAVHAFDCYQPPEQGSAGTTSAEIVSADVDTVQDRLRSLSRSLVEQHLSRNDRRRNQLRVDEHLLRNLRVLRSSLSGAVTRRASIDRLIGRSIFIRYFEDRGILTPEHTFELADGSSYVEVLRMGREQAYRLYGKLAERFNGDIFGIDRRLEQDVTDSDLTEIAAFLDRTDLQSGQGSLWPYDFSVIPPDMISAVYEQLLSETQRADAAYYTPRPLVELLLDEALPWEVLSATTPTMLDPACGSGIFLTEAFRRARYARTRTMTRSMSLSEQIELLTSCFFGIDINRSAVEVASLGLYLALLEEVDPPTIWRDAHLPRLVDRNLNVSDFFDFDPSVGGFDVVIGNPPWKSALTGAASTYAAEHGLRVADKQIALAFVHKATLHLRADGCIAMLLPAKPFLQNRSSTALRFRRLLLEILQVVTLVDLSLLRRSSFRSAVAPAVAVVAELRDAGDESSPTSPTAHVVPRLTPLQSAVDGLVVSQDDVHHIDRDLLDLEPDVWKILLWGDMHDHELVRHLRRSFPSLGAVAQQRNWSRGRGYQVDGGDENDASFLVGRLAPPVEALTPFSLDRNMFTRIDAPLMHRPRTADLYGGPMVLVRRGLSGGRPAACYVEEGAPFSDSFIGVAGSRTDQHHLRVLTGILNSSVAYYYHFMTASSWGVERDYVELNEHLSLPIPALDGPNADRIYEAVLQAELVPSHEATWRPALDEAVYRSYSLSPRDIDRVKDALSIRLSQFQDGAQSAAFHAPDEQDVAGYVRTLDETLNIGLGGDVVEVRSAGGAAGYRFVTVEFLPSGSSTRPTADETLTRLVHLVDQEAELWPSPVVYFQPCINVLDDTQVHVVKPDERRYWSRSAARSDASELVGQILASSAAAEIA